MLRRARRGRRGVPGRRGVGGGAAGRRGLRGGGGGGAPGRLPWWRRARRGPGPPRRRRRPRRWDPGRRDCRAEEACLRRRAPGSRCPQPEGGPGLRASWNEGGQSERGLPLEPHFCFPEPHRATSAGPPSDREPLAFLGPQGESLGLGSEEGTILRGCRECARRAHWRRTF